MIWHIFQKSTMGVKQRREKINLNIQKLTFDMNLDTFITCTVPISVLIQKHVCEGSNNRERAQESSNKSGWNEIFYIITRVPPSSEVFCSTFFHRLCTTTAYAPLRVCAHVNVHMHTQAHAYTWQTKEETKYRKRGEETRFGMSLSVFYSYIILFCIPLHGREQGDWNNNQECDVTLCWGLYSARLLLLCKLT